MTANIGKFLLKYLRQQVLRDVLLDEDPGHVEPPQDGKGVLQDRVMPIEADPQVADHDPE